MKALSCIMALALFYLLICCTNQRSENQRAPLDSTTADQTFQENDTLTSGDSKEDQIIKSIENIANEIKVDSSAYYSIKAYFNGYESRADQTWYVDSELVIQFGEVSWSLEGRSRTSTYYFKNDELIAEKEENDNGGYGESLYLLKRNGSVLGFARKSGEKDEVSYLSEAKYQSEANSCRSNFNKLLTRIREYGDSIVVSGVEATIHIASKEHVGENVDYTNREDYFIDKRILQKLLR